MSASAELARVVAVLALVGVAAALATPQGRLPLALRGVLRILRKDLGSVPASVASAVPAWKRLLAFLLVLLAVALAFFRGKIGG